MWITMMAGKRVFRVSGGELQLCFNPALPGWLFDERGEVSFTFLGKTQVTYRNPGKKDTYGSDAATIRGIAVHKADGSAVNLEGSVIAGGLAEDIRSGGAIRIDIDMA